MEPKKNAFTEVYTPTEIVRNLFNAKQQALINYIVDLKFLQKLHASKGDVPVLDDMGKDIAVTRRIDQVKGAIANVVLRLATIQELLDMGDEGIAGEWQEIIKDAPEKESGVKTGVDNGNL